MPEFPVHTADTAPDASRAALANAQQAFGFVPNLIATMATSPALAEGYLALSEIYAKSDFNPVERQVVLLAASFENECHYCMAAHSVVAQMSGMDETILQALRDGTPLPDAKLEALKQFTVAVVTGRGWVDAAGVQAFLDGGYGERHVLEVVLGVAVKTMSNYTNHLVGTPVDGAFEATAWTHPDKRQAAE